MIIWIKRLVLVVLVKVDLKVLIRWVGSLEMKLIVLESKKCFWFGRVSWCIEVFKVVKSMFFLKIFFLDEILKCFISWFMIVDLLVLV